MQSTSQREVELCADARPSFQCPADCLGSSAKVASSSRPGESALDKQRDDSNQQHGKAEEANHAQARGGPQHDAGKNRCEEQVKKQGAAGTSRGGDPAWDPHPPTP